MGTPQPFTSAKLVFGLLVSPQSEPGPAIDRLRERFGDLDYRSRPIAFDFTRYYEEEMGAPLTRYFVAAKGLVSPERLAETKCSTNEIEHELSSNGGRSVNIDPGLLFESNFVLATTKPFSHRIPLSRGIYGEVTLIFEKGDFRPQPWTYPDYASEEYREVLHTIRDLYRSQF